MKSHLSRFWRSGLSGNRLILLTAAFLVITSNASFFTRAWAIYGDDGTGRLALASLPLALGLATTILLACIAVGRFTRYVLAITVVTAAGAAYFMDSFGIVINDEMFQNVAQTQASEAMDLLNPRLAAYLLLLGILPAALLLHIPSPHSGWRRELIARIGLIAITTVLLAGIGLGFGDFYASFIREHKEIRSYANPAYPFYSALKYFAAQLNDKDNGKVLIVGADAKRPADDVHRELVIVVVGETARADRFSLNGYGRPTNPRLADEQVVSFTNMHACGTSTAVSVPCMFSGLGREQFSAGKARQRENVLDVIQRSGAYVLWLDNNSDSKGVAVRIPYENYRTPAANHACDDECRDEGMLENLQRVIDSRPERDIVIVLHQMGNHGPAYYKRYPPAFEKFAPACRSNDLSHCTADEIGNAYDNAILYTDHFLFRIIALLKRNDARFETAMFYLSDHGESLGEGGIYLHGLPYAVAPKAQTHVPAIMWFGAGFDEIDPVALRSQRNRPLSHDNLFHTLLGFLEIETDAYRADMDILQPARKPDKR
jgi:lipid A ethanolaminephosphotransferase